MMDIVKIDELRRFGGVIASLYEVIIAEIPIWLRQSPAWPNLTYDASRLASPLKRARIEYGRLLGKAEILGAMQPNSRLGLEIRTLTNWPQKNT